MVVIAAGAVLSGGYFLLKNSRKRQIDHGDDPNQYRGVFDLNRFDDEWCWKHLRFEKEGITRLAGLLHFPPEDARQKAFRASYMELFCLYLFRLHRPCTWHEVGKYFTTESGPRRKSQLSAMFNFFEQWLVRRWSYLVLGVSLSTLDPNEVLIFFSRWG